MPQHDRPIERLVAQTDSLYSLPAVAVEVLKLTEQPNVDARQLKECIEKDPALTAKLLRVVNSALFGLSREVSDLNQALALLGIKPLKLLVLGFSLPDGLFSGVQRELLTRYWNRTLTKAVAARELCNRLKLAAGDDAFLAGLLQDLGMLVLIQQVGDPYVRFVEQARGDWGQLAELERLALSFDHVELTARLLEQWGMPEALVEAIVPIEGEFRPSKSTDDVRSIIHLADLITQIVVDQRTALLPVLVADGGLLGLRESEWETFFQELQDKVLGLADVLMVELPDDLNYAEVLQQAHQRLVREASEAAAELAALRRQHEAAAAAGTCGELAAAVARITATPRSTPTTTAQSGESSSTSESARLIAEDAPAATATADREAATVDARRTAADDPALVNRIAMAVAACRQARCALSLLLVEVDHFRDLLFQLGPDQGNHLRQLVEMVCRSIDHPAVWCDEVHEAQFAVLLAGCERDEAVRRGNELVRAIRKLGSDSQPDRPTITVSIGAATVTMPPKNFLAEDLVEAASRCLYGAQASGGNTLKSIEIY